MIARAPAPTRSRSRLHSLTPQPPKAAERCVAGSDVRRHWVTLAAGAGLAALAGCAQTPDATVQALPQPDATLPHARLLARASVPQDHRFVVVVQQDNATCTRPAWLTRGTAQQAAPAARLPVDQLITLDLAIVNTGTGKACINRWSFTPRAGRTYLVQGGIAGAQCPARLLDATTPDRAALPPDLVGRVLPGQNCVPLDKAPRPAALSLIQGGQHNGDAVLNPNANARDLEGLIRP